MPFFLSKLGIKWIELSVSLLKRTKLFDVSEMRRASPEGMSILFSAEGSRDDIPFLSGSWATFLELYCSLLTKGEGDKLSRAYFNFSWTMRPGDIEWIFFGWTPTSFLTSFVASLEESFEIGTLF